jgi:hypothetical protein
LKLFFFLSRLLGRSRERNLNSRELDAEAALAVLDTIDKKLSADIASISPSSSWRIYAPPQIGSAGCFQQVHAQAGISLSLFCSLDYGRLGNKYAVLRHLIQISLFYSIDKLYLDYDETLRTFFDFKIFPVEFLHCSTFPQQSGEYVLALDSKELFESDGRVYACGEQMHAALRQSFLSPIEPYDIATLVIHIRAGDIFRGATVHPFYHQPPLAWYIFCLREHQKRYGSISIMLVYEDKGNPCIDALIAWCKDAGIPISSQSSRIVAEDYTHLVRAQALVTCVI